MRTPRFLAMAAAAVLILSACGSDGGDDAIDSGDVQASADESSDDAGDAGEGAAGDATDETDDVAAAATECPATSGSFETVDGTTLGPTSALAARILDGQAYTIYLADRPLGADEVSFVAGPTAGADEVIVTMAITTFNAEGTVEPVVVGESIDYTSDFGVRTFVVTGDVGGDLLGNSTDAEGTVEVTAVEGRFCAVVTYVDTEKTLTAVIDAEIVDI